VAPLLRLPLLLAAAAAGLLGCNDLEVCGSHAEEVRQADGAAYRCIQAEDCPRASRVFVCTTDVSPERECVKCADSICVRVIPEACE
jgi:hypothetical protein